MKSNTYYTTKERSKVFKRLGALVGITATKKTQRGIIARKALTILEDYELEKFSKSFHKFEFTTLKVNKGGETYYL
jgi:hypothetical protein